MRLLTVFFLIIAYISAGQKLTVNGIVKSEKGEPIPYATIIDSINNAGKACDANGYFSINLKSGINVLQASHVSFQKQTKAFFVDADTSIVFTMKGLEINEILVSGTPLNRQALLGMHFLESSTIQNIPTFFGEQDIMKAMTVLPGIAGGIDMYSSIYVRGGNRDQNLFLLDGARIYTTSVAGGLSSLFNSDIIKNVDIYKGLAPAKYGEGVSSVIDVSLIDGKGKPTARIDIGTLRSGFLLKGLNTDKFGYYLTGRISNLDFVSGDFLKKFKLKYRPENNYELYRFEFWDVDGKFTWTPKVRTLLSLGFHKGNEENSTLSKKKNINYDNNEFYNQSDSRGNYSINNNLRFNFNHLFKSGISINYCTWFTDYKQNYRGEIFSDHHSVPIHNITEKGTFVNDFSNRLEFKILILHKHNLQIGTKYSRFLVSPEYGKRIDRIINQETILGVSKKSAVLMAFYAIDNFNISSNSTLRIGLRYNKLLSDDTIFNAIEPRVSLSVKLSPTWAYMGGYAITSQPFHVIAQNFGDREDESWMLSNKNLDMQKAWQLSSGFFGSIPGTAIEISNEMFYKQMHNLTMFAHNGFEVKSKLDHLFFDGEGVSYGNELLIQKTSGQIQWSIAYTLAWSKRQFDRINQGDWFNAEFDRRHDLNLNINYSWKDKNIFNVNYIFQSGRPFTMPSAYVNQTSFYNGFYVIGNINNARTPAYKRCDVSYRRIGKVLWGRNFEYNLTIMNVLAQKNPSAVYLNNGQLIMKSWYIVIPSAQIKINLFKN